MNRILLGYNPDHDLFAATPGGARAPGRAPRATVAGKIDTTEQAAELLDNSRGAALTAWMSEHLQRAAQASGRALSSAVTAELARGLTRIAAITLPSVPGRAARAARVFGMELEGLSPEDQEFELARRFVLLTTEAAEHASGLPPTVPAATAARQALTLAARRQAPGLLRPVPAVFDSSHRPAPVIGSPRAVPYQGARHA